MRGTAAGRLGPAGFPSTSLNSRRNDFNQTLLAGSVLTRPPYFRLNFGVNLDRLAAHQDHFYRLVAGRHGQDDERQQGPLDVEQ
jgi:hypothetical protein